MTRLLTLTLATAVTVAACAEHDPAATEPSFAVSLAGSRAMVTTNADAGPGSFRQAMLDANADPAVTLIHLAPALGTIAVTSPVVFSGSQALTIHGAGAELDGAALPAGASVLVANGGGDLAISDLTIENAPGSGIVVDVPDAATGTLSFSFDQVTIRDNGFHGVLINDQAEYFTDPASTSAAGSDASLVVRLTGSRIEGNGNGALDNDGFRVNEGGPGGIDATVLGSVFTGNGADGLELDERAAGNAIFTLQNTTLTENGAFSVIDLDDGIDVDEAGDGDVIGRFVDVRASDNSEQGVDLNENDAGDLCVVMSGVEASGNGQEGIEFEEDDDFAGGGGIDAELADVMTNGNGLANDGDAGLKLREKGVGDLRARVTVAGSSGNVNGVGGILVREDAGGNMDAEITRATAADNAAYGLRLQGTGAARLRRVSASGNAGLQIQSDAGVSVTVVP
jgi:hypothetical protein